MGVVVLGNSDVDVDTLQLSLLPSAFLPLPRKTPSFTHTLSLLFHNPSVLPAVSPPIKDPLQDPSS